MTNAPVISDTHDHQPREGALFIPALQALILLAVITSVTLLGAKGVLDAQAVAGILGTIAGGVGVLAGVGMVSRRNGRRNGS